MEDIKKAWEVPALIVLGDLETLTEANRSLLPGDLVVAQVTGI